MSKVIYGLDLGTTNSVLCKWENGEAVLCSELYPSIVDLRTTQSGPRMKSRIQKGNAETIIQSFKVDVEQDYAVNASASIIRDITAGHDFDELVISVPAYFNAQQRANTKRAAEKQGITVAGLINEPTAAALYYNRNRKDLTLIYDLGGGTFDTSIVDTRFGTDTVIATKGLRVGGDNLDLAIFQYLANKCKLRKHMMSTTQANQLKEFCRDLKHTMQKTRDDIDVSLEQFSEIFGETRHIFTEDTYRKLVEITFRKTFKMVSDLIEESSFSKEELRLVLVGGSTRDPYLIELIEEFIGVQPQPLTYDPDYIVALGVAYYAHLLSEGLAEHIVMDVTQALGVGVVGGRVLNIIPENSIIPIKKMHTVVNPAECDTIRMEIYQGTGEFVSECNCIGSFTYSLDKLYHEAGEVIILITFNLDRDGTLEVTVGEVGKKSVTVQLKV